MDQLLLQFIEAPDEAPADRWLASLIDEHAVPIVREILGSSLRFHLDNNGTASTQDANDLFNDIIANLLTRLRHIRKDRAQGVISDFRGYIAVTAYNACNLYLRQKYPRRSRLKNRFAISCRMMQLSRSGPSRYRIASDVQQLYCDLSSRGNYTCSHPCLAAFGILRHWLHRFHVELCRAIGGWWALQGA